MSVKIDEGVAVLFDTLAREELDMAKQTRHPFLQPLRDGFLTEQDVYRFFYVSQVFFYQIQNSESTSDEPTFDEALESAASLLNLETAVLKKQFGETYQILDMHDLI